MSQTRLKKMKSTESDYVYHTTRNPKGEKLELKKYDPVVRKRVTFKEVKK